MPSLKFNCDGNITHLMFAASGNNNADLQFQAWQPLPPGGEATAYTLVTTVDVSLRLTSGRTTITEALASPLPVSASNVLGVLVTNTNDVTLSASELRQAEFTMYSAGETGQTLRVSDLATSTTLSLYVSVSFGELRGIFCE